MKELTKYLLQQYQDKKKLSLLRVGTVFSSNEAEICDTEIQGTEYIHIVLSEGCPLQRQKRFKKKWNLFFTLMVYYE